MTLESERPGDIFIKTSTVLIAAIDEAMRRLEKLPGLILFYSSLDIFASLTRPISMEDTSGNIFTQWIDDCLLPFPGLRCSSMDLWGARCGLLHTLTTESRKSRLGDARELAYISDDNVAALLQKADPDARNHVVIGIPTLMRAFIAALDKFIVHLKSDDTLRRTAECHLIKIASTLNLTEEDFKKFS